MDLIHSTGESIKNRFTQTVPHYVHGPNSCHLLHSKPKPFNKMQQTNGIRMVLVKMTHLSNPLWTPSKRQFSFSAGCSVQATPRKGSSVQLSPVHWSLSTNSDFCLLLEQRYRSELKIRHSLCTLFTGFVEFTDYSQISKNADTTTTHTPVSTAVLQLLHMPCQCKDSDFYEIRKNLSCHFLYMMLSCAETSLNKAFQIAQMTVIVGTDLWHTEYWHYPANIKTLRL